jgi:F-type H+-transporting ATPase subunit epsilon
MKISVITPYGSYLEEEADFVKLPGKEGELGILPNHSALISTLTIGELIIEKNEEKSYYFIPDGIVKVDKDSVSLLVSYVESSTEIDFKRAEASLDRAVKHLTDRDSNADAFRARNSKLRAQRRLDIYNTVESRQS